MNASLYKLKRDIVEAGRRVYQRNFVASNDGNISARADSRRIVITPSGVSKGFLKAEDLVVVDLDGNVLEGRGKPSSELPMHLRMFRDRPDVNGVVHAHPPKATGFAVAGIPLTQCVLPEVIVGLGGIPLAEYGTPGTDEFYEPVLKYLKDYDAFLLANHGALTIGSDVMNAYYKMETLEHFAHIAFVALQLGNMNTIGEADVQKLIDLRANFGIKTTVSCERCDRRQTESCTVSPARNNASLSDSHTETCGVTPADSADDREALIRSITDAVIRQIGAN